MTVAMVMKREREWEKNRERGQKGSVRKIREEDK